MTDVPRVTSLLQAGDVITAGELKGGMIVNGFHRDGHCVGHSPGELVGCEPTDDYSAWMGWGGVHEPVVVSAPVKPESWLGRWDSQGWSIRIQPGLTDADWEQFSARSRATWNAESGGYDPRKCVDVLRILFPDRRCEITFPLIEIDAGEVGYEMLAILFGERIMQDIRLDMDALSTWEGEGGYAGS